MSFEPFSQTEKGIYMNFEIRLTSISNFLEDCEKAFDKYIQGELTQIGKAIDRGEYSNDYPKDNLLRGFNEAIHKEMVPYFVLSYVILVTVSAGVKMPSDDRFKNVR